MKYDRNRKTIRNILKTADIANTLNGGVSQPRVDFKKMADHYLTSASVPGVDIASLHVEIVNKFVIISHPLKFSFDTIELHIPHVIASVPISPDVDYKNITATEENGILQIIMPFNELAGDYHKKVEINR